MRISRRTSGGRGEYELSGYHNDTRARDLEGYVFSLDLPGELLIHTRIILRIQGGKPRLRKYGADIQIQKQLAATFMMPDPAREDAVLGVGEPVMQEGAYAVEHIEIDSLARVNPNVAILNVSRITILNGSHRAEEEDLRLRADMLQEIWARRGEFPEDIAALLGRHEAMVRSGQVTNKTRKLVAAIQRVISDRSDDLGIVYSERGDVLPKLADALNYQVPQPLIQVEAVDPEDIELKKRAAKEWKRWANARGPASARFRQEVRDAYHATCFVCGAYFPKIPGKINPGVDAAHILPWSEYDLDEIFNGLCLCKIHHWAFDEDIIRIYHNGRDYVSTISEDVKTEILESEPEFSLDVLEKHVGIIPGERLPADRQQWPRPQLLGLRSEML